MIRISLIILSFTLLLSCGKVDSPENQRFTRFVDAYFESFFHFHPEWGTEAGFHQFDQDLPNFTKAALDSEVTFLRASLDSLQKINFFKLDESNQYDYRILENKTKGNLWDLEKIRNWERNPSHYNLSGYIYTLMIRNFAPLKERLKSVIAREKKIPAALEAAKKNLHNPPRIFTQTAINQFKGGINFFKETVPLAFKAVKDEKLREEFRKVNEKVVKSYEDFIKFLEKELLPASKGDFAIGKENYQKILLYEEMIDTPVDTLLSWGWEELRRTQNEFTKVAAEIDERKNPLEILKEIEKEHPPGDSLIPFTQSLLEDIRQFCMRNIVTIPSEVRCQVTETPEFERELAFASMDAPGAYEQVATEAYYYINPPDPKWNAKKKEDYLSFYNRYNLQNLSVHETYPGHYVQFLWSKSCPSKVRKLTWSGVFSEGWAHYCEQMILDEGYGKEASSPQTFNKMRLAQLQWALIRICRFIVGISLHTKGMTLDQAKDFFKREAYMEEVTAEREAIRGTYDPTYLVYTLGKMEILKLRAEYKKLKGDKFMLKDFHNQLLKNGQPPISIVRQMLLGKKRGGGYDH